MNRRKSTILIAMVALLLTFTVSGTIAWLADSTESIENVFTPGKVDTEIEEGFSTTAKTSIVVKNDKGAGSTVPVFVRVSVSGYYVKDGEIVEPWGGLSSVNTTGNTTDNDGIANGGWVTGSDGYYYYSGVVAPGEVTTNLLTSNGIDLTKREDGSYLVVNVLHQTIQAEPASTVTAAWGVTVSNGTISKN